MRAILTWIGTVLGLLMVCVLVLLLTFEWWAKALIAQQASTAIGRRVIIAGDLNVTWSWTPQITIEHLRLANTAWSPEPYMSTLRRLAVHIDLRKLLQGHVVIPMIEVQEPMLLLESSAKGIPNWLFMVAWGETSPQAAEPPAPPMLPTIGQVRIQRGRVAYHDYSTGTSITGSLSELVATTAGPEQMLEVRGSGQFEEQPFELTVLAGALSTLQADAPYPLRTQVRLGTWRLTLAGTLAYPLQLAGVNLDVAFEGMPAQTSSNVSARRQPHEPLYRLAGHLTRHGDAWVVEALTGVVGNSDLAGRVAISMPGIRPFLQADLTSRSLAIDSIVSTLAGGHSRTEQDDTESASESADPVIDLQVTRAVNGIVSLQATTVTMSQQTLHNVTAHAHLQDGRLTLKPRFAFAGGSIDATIALEDREGPLHSAIVATIQQVNVKQLLPAATAASAVAGSINGTADLVVAGRTVSELIASMHGKAALTLLDAQHDTDVTIGFATLAGESEDTGRQVNLTGTGRVRGQALRLSGRAGSLYALHTGDNPYPLQATFQLGETQARIEGTVSEPWQFTGLKAHVAFEGPDPAVLSALLPFALPHLPAYQFKGHLHREGHTWSMRDFTGTIGKSDVAGTLVFDTSDERLFLRGHLQAQRLQVDELATAMARAQEPTTTFRSAPAQVEERRAVPAMALDPALLRILDAELRFQGEHIHGIKLPINGISTTMQMRRGHLHLSSTIGLGGGILQAEIEVIGADNPVKSAVNARFDQVDLSEVLRKLAKKPAAFGKLDGRIAVAGVGASSDTFLKSINGDVSITMAGGHLDSLIVELMGLDVGEAVVTALVDPKDKVAIHCLLADFIVTQGTLQTQLLLFDTSDTKIVGEGSIDVGKEMINLKLTPRAKDFSLFSAEAPLYLTGRLHDISAKPKLGEVLLSLALPIKPGTKEDADCQGLRQMVQKYMQPSKARY